MVRPIMTITLSMLIAGCASSSARPTSPQLRPGPAAGYPYVPDLGDGSYRNPVLLADYSDPDVIRVGHDYFLVASSFHLTPALPILQSRDLVNWKLVGHATAAVPGARFASPQLGHGVWAPAIREHGGAYFIYFPNYCKPSDGGDCAEEGIWLVSAPHPLGPWSDPHQVLAERGVIDPCPFWDDDGRAYLVHAYAKSRAGINSRLDIRPMAPDGRSLLGRGQQIYSDPENQPTIEGPKLYKRNGWYLILAPAGGVDHGWQVALRSRDIYGPYEARRVLEQGATAINGPHQGALVDTPDGSEWWFVHFQALWPYGRVVHLNPVTWQDDWPLMGMPGADGKREPVTTFRKPAIDPQPIAIPATSDDFDGPSLGLQWQWQANHDKNWYSLAARPGWLRLFAQDRPDHDLLRLPSLLLQKVPARTFTVTATVELSGPGVRAGLAVTGKQPSAVIVEERDRAIRLTLLVKGYRTTTVSLPRAPLRLQISVQDGGLFQFAYDVGAGPQRLAKPFQEGKGYWIGARVGLFAMGASGHADFDGFQFSALAAGQRKSPGDAVKPSL